ncbi:hypothetical protein [Desulfobacca acetoxidans]
MDKARIHRAGGHCSHHVPLVGTVGALQVDLVVVGCDHAALGLKFAVNHGRGFGGEVVHRREPASLYRGQIHHPRLSGRCLVVAEIIRDHGRRDTETKHHGPEQYPKIAASFS